MYRIIIANNKRMQKKKLAESKTEVKETKSSSSIAVDVKDEKSSPSSDKSKIDAAASAPTAKSTSPALTIEVFADEILLNIFRFLTPMSLVLGTRVCRKWQRILMDECFEDVILTRKLFVMSDLILTMKKLEFEYAQQQTSLSSYITSVTSSPHTQCRVLKDICKTLISNISILREKLKTIYKQLNLPKSPQVTDLSIQFISLINFYYRIASNHYYSDNKTQWRNFIGFMLENGLVNFKKCYEYQIQIRSAGEMSDRIFTKTSTVIDYMKEEEAKEENANESLLALINMYASGVITFGFSRNGKDISQKYEPQACRTLALKSRI